MATWSDQSKFTEEGAQKCVCVRVCMCECVYVCVYVCACTYGHLLDLTKLCECAIWSARTKSMKTSGGSSETPSLMCEVHMDCQNSEQRCVRYIWNARTVSTKMCEERWFHKDPLTILSSTVG